MCIPNLERENQIKCDARIYTCNLGTWEKDSKFRVEVDLSYFRPYKRERRRLGEGELRLGGRGREEGGDTEERGRETPNKELTVRCGHNWKDSSFVHQQ